VKPKTTLNPKNLQALGAKRLAELLVEISSGDPVAGRRLRLELAGAQSAGELGREVRKRINTLARSRSFVDWQGIRALAEDLDTQRAAIVKMAKADPKDALDLLWKFMGLAPAVFERCDDSNGRVISVFHQACSDMRDIALQAKADPVSLADQVFEALRANDYGQFDKLIAILSPALGQVGLEHLKGRMIDLANRPVTRPAQKDRVKIGWSSSGPIYADETAERSRVSKTRLALMDIADALGDVDGFIEQYDSQVRKVPKIAADIAQRMLAAGRVEEAWQAIQAAERGRPQSRWNWPDFAWEDARIAVLEALQHPEDAQAARWGCFERSLSSRYLREYLQRLADFEDIEAERKALDYAESSRNLLQALSFFISWPAVDRAAHLVLKRSGELDGDHYEILAPAADALAAKHPLAATMILRAMIDFCLKNSRASRYRHAARHLLDCSGLASAIMDFRDFEPHDAYEARLRREHGRKSSFWALVI
jgi:uncharacterized protein DUF6880